MRRLILVLALALPVLAQTTTYRVLLPVYTPEPIAGAFGSRWETTLAIHNPSNASEFHIDWCQGSSIPLFDVCTRILRHDALLEKGETQSDTLPPFGPGPGPTESAPRLLYIRPFPRTGSATGDPAQLVFALRALDVSRSSTNAGTEIPVVRQEQFRTSALNLLNVPVDPAFRLTLRLYELNLKTAAFTIRLFDASSGALVGGRDVALSFRHEHHWVAMFEPPHLQIGDLTALVPAGTTLPSKLRIEVQPRSEGSAFWAFVSITNNDTQHLTLVTPQ